MRRIGKYLGWIVLGLALFATGCSSGDDRPGLFEAQVAGLDGAQQTTGSATFVTDSDEVEIILFDETRSGVSELVFRGLPPLDELEGGQTYAIRPDGGDGETPSARAELTLEQDEPRLDGERGTLQIDGRSEDVITGQFFELEFRGSITDPIFIDGEFEALRSE